MKKLILILMIFITSLSAGASSADKNDTGLIIKTEYFESGKVKNEFVKLDSYYKVIRYYESGSVEEIGYYNYSNEKTGEWVRYYDGGKLSATANYVDGIKHGDWKFYNLEGNVITYLKYKNGKRVEAFMWSETKGIVCQ